MAIYQVKCESDTDTFLIEANNEEKAREEFIAFMKEVNYLGIEFDDKQEICVSLVKPVPYFSKVHRLPIALGLDKIRTFQE